MKLHESVHESVNESGMERMLEEEKRKRLSEQKNQISTLVSPLTVFNPKCVAVNRSSKESTSFCLTAQRKTTYTPMLRCTRKVSPEPGERFDKICTRRKIHLLIATTSLGKGLFDDARPQRSIRSTRSWPSRTVAVSRHDIINDHGPPGAASRGLDGVPVVKDAENMWKYLKVCERWL